MSLTEYQRKRHFDKTSEPKAKRARAKGQSFVVQKHAASHLHYDFRLELDGVLKSWAVPKGPSLDPAIKRLAMHVEDHPVDYGSFEGIIPQGEYGGGTVMLWDRGTWEPIGDPDADYEAGRLKFHLHGEKLKGGWMLVRIKNPKEKADGRQWLLIKERDDDARPGAKGDLLDDKPLSVTTGRTMDAITADRDWIWNATETKKRKPRAKAVSSKKSRRTQPPPKVRTNEIEYDTQAKQFAGVRLTSPEKILYPEEKVTKLELAAYYAAIADWMLPHIADRPLALVRCPEGRAKACFFQKHPAVGTPDEFRQIAIREKAGTEQYLIVDDVSALISLAQIGALEVHVWGSRADKLELPDRLIFDLDPDPSVSLNQLVEAAHQVRHFLLELGLESFIKTTGGKGFHLVVPIVRRYKWDEVKAFCKDVADLIVRADPDGFTANMAKAARTKKIFIDYLRNGRGATAVAPYSPRARPGATVSAPLSWEEFGTDLRPDCYSVRNIISRLSALNRDPWAGFSSMRQGLAESIKRVRALRGE